MTLSLLCVALVLIAAYFIYAGFKYTRMIGAIFFGLVYKPRPAFTGPSRGKKVTILDSSDQEIEILFLENEGSGKAAIFCHESGAAKESWEKYAYFLPSLGYHILSVDLRTSATAQEQNPLSQWPNAQDTNRVLTVVRWAKKAIRADGEFLLFGVSNGADIALAASFHEEAVRAVVADGLFSMKEIFRDYIRKWAPIVVKPNLFGQNYPRWVVEIFMNLGFGFCQRKSKKWFIDVEGLLRRPHVPLLVIHGDLDDYVPATHQMFLEKLNAKKAVFERLTVHGAGHNEAAVKNRKLYEDKITDFLKALSD